MQNKELELAWNFVNNTNRNIFLTGKAGTGKTTFLHSLREQTLKRMIVVAPTGVAAINARGVTIHSFFQLPFGPILPNRDLNTSQDFRFSKIKINIIKSLDLLIIDEISMVRADLLDGIDQVLRRYRKRDKVFGGVQVLMIGDLQQLSPVIKEHEWNLLSTFYSNGYFFNSIAFKACNALTIELKHIYRQENPVFINILNQIRNNSLSQTSIDILNKQVIEDFTPSENEGYISLTTHNYKADKINLSELAKIPEKVFSFKAEIHGKFPEHSYPNNQIFALKKGAQVMFIKNDSSPEKRYYNGKIGKVVELGDDEVIVKCPEDDFQIVTTPEVWENFDYVVDKETNDIKEHKIGSFKQMPLRLAWAITIHKSQGLTFEKAIIDAQDAFAHGQTYVALSRCKSLDGLILKSKIHPNQIISDNQVLKFNDTAESNQPDVDVLKQSQIDYQFQLIAEIFDCYALLQPVNKLLDIYYKNRNSIEGQIDLVLNDLKTEISSLLKVSSNFNAQLKSLTSPDILPQKHHLIQERFAKAVGYFNNQLKDKISQPFQSLQFSTDNSSVESDILKQLNQLEELIGIKLFYFKNLKNEFHVENYLKFKAQSIFLKEEQPKQKRKPVLSSTSNTKLFELLKDLRSNLAQEYSQMHYQIFTQKSLYAMCEMLPTTKKELSAIHGMGKTRVNKYGDVILEVIRAYCEVHDIVPNRMDQVETKIFKKSKIDTKTLSFELFKDGKTVEEIASMRELTENTIFGHLASYIPSGKIKVTDLMPDSHYNELKQIIPTLSFDNLSDLKNQVDDKYSYAELRLVLNALQS
jgi:hypothetical protein